MESSLHHVSSIRRIRRLLRNSSHLIYPLTARVVGAPQMILQPVCSIFPCSPLPSGTWRTPGLSIPWCCLPTPFFCLPCQFYVLLVFSFVLKNDSNTLLCTFPSLLRFWLAYRIMVYSHGTCVGSAVQLLTAAWKGSKEKETGRLRSDPGIPLLSCLRVIGEFIGQAGNFCPIPFAGGRPNAMASGWIPSNGISWALG